MKEQKSKGYQPKERYGSAGYGLHGDRRLKRLRTRQTQKQQWKKEWL